MTQTFAAAHAEASVALHAQAVLAEVDPEASDYMRGAMAGAARMFDQFAASVAICDDLVALVLGPDSSRE
jgi:hypothetical protein